MTNCLHTIEGAISGLKILLTFIFFGVSFHNQVYVFGFSAPAEFLYTQFLSETLY